MGKAADAQQGDRDKRAAEQANHTRQDHQRRAHGDDQFAGYHDIHAKDALENPRQIATDNAAHIGEQHRDPREHGDIFQVKTVGVHHKQRDPRVKRPPCRFSQEARQGDTPEFTLTQQLADVHLIHHLTLRLSAGDVVEFVFAQAFALPRAVINQIPTQRPDHAGDTDDDKRQTPAMNEDGPCNQRRRNNRPHGRTNVEIADGDGALVIREPFGDGFQTGGDHRTLGKTAQAAEQRQTLPAIGESCANAENAPHGTKQGVADFGAKGIQHIARDRLCDGVTSGEGCHNPGVLLGSNVKIALQRWRCGRNSIAG